MDDTTAARFDARLTALETAVAALRVERSPQQARPEDPLRRPATAPVSAALRPPAPLTQAAGNAPSGWPSLETLLAGRGLQFAGLLLILIGTAYFLTSP